MKGHHHLLPLQNTSQFDGISSVKDPEDTVIGKATVPGTKLDVNWKQETRGRKIEKELRLGMDPRTARIRMMA
ncbi:hypothetical protein DM860_002501 [Cuscuta australis]|uniref:Uncharacterized protein n=1 Tax=Cuscuta australis TaxID=267555 RepID=A0A328D3Q1_9ASTE|nr:hypothetical protein DM860_002501 [Cuscuta australis]